jgi:lipoprotein-anchoring transpeptidase ErfK/SrfK
LFRLLPRILLLALLLGGIAPVLTGDAAPPVLIPRAVTLAGVPLGGMAVEQAQAAMRPVFAKPLRVVYRGHEWRVNAARFGTRVAIVDGVARALVAQPGARVALVPRLDIPTVRRYVRILDRRFSFPATDAKLLGLQGIAPHFSVPRTGIQVDRPVTVARIVRALRSPLRPVVHVSAHAVAPKQVAADFGSIIVIRRGINELRLYDGPALVRTFPVATGRAQYPTPTGQWEIVDMQYNPWWRPPDSPWAQGLKPIPPGPGNPLGTRWMGLSAAGVGIHGTPDAASVGYSASHGCIRMQIPDAEWLFQHVSVGTPVFIVDA